MRPWIILALVATVGTGCTHTALERRTVKQASTLTDLQHQQVLDNLAAIACNPEALPWHVKLKGGLVQVADQGSGTFGAEFGAILESGNGSKFIPGVSGQRGVVNQWDVDPTSEPEELELLRLAYRKATDPANPEVDAEILKVIGGLSVRFDILPKREVRRQLFLKNDTLAIITNRLSEVEAHISKLQNDITPKKDSEKKLNRDFFDPMTGPEVVAKKELEDRTAVLRRLVQERYELTEVWELVHKDTIAPASVGSVRLGITGAQVLERTRHELYTLDGTGDQKRAVNQPAGQKTLLLAAIEMSLGSYVPSQELREASQRNVGLIAQAEDKIRKLEDLLEKFNTPWLACGKKHDVPKCACYIGRHRGCTGDCHVWVMPDQLGTLREFTLIVLALAPIEKQELFPSRGAAFSPSFR
ncbi:MAG: hypothetical protein K2X82_19940 [Gemmataceae bacterium]|nr:hypothetical protein [Gemmataceae bacterium]